LKRITTKAALIKAFTNHRPYEDIIQHVRDTPYQGSISEFVNELKFRSSKVHNKLELELNQLERSIYTNFLNKTIKDFIERKFPDRLYNSLLTIINPNVKITEGFGEVHIKIITIKNIILSRTVIQDIITITTQTIQQILMVHQTEIKFPLETKVIIMSLGEI